MKNKQRFAGGLWCTEVLDRLNAYLDNELDAESRGRVEAHVTECDWCASMGTSVGSVVQELRARLAEPEPVDDALAARLRAIARPQ
ncbi:MAG: zf-HC2 domain-containing protein [Bryobacter sp.]|jgi:anti-sigma factor RsiW|nr:zf-HC2 domain-containing protein [Bryobacter sp.]